MATLDPSGTGTNDNITTIGSDTSPGQTILYIQTPALGEMPAILAMDAVTAAGVRTTYYLWVDSTGDLRIGTALPTNEDGDGSVVGGQS